MKSIYAAIVVFLAVVNGIGGSPVPFETGICCGKRTSRHIIESCSNLERHEREWLKFRNAFPFHIQTLAVSSPYPDGSRTIIISEPPPHVTVEGAAAIDPTRLAKNELKTWTIGFDGWGRDLVFRVPSLTDQELDDLKKKLYRYLFFTDYKYFALKLPIDQEVFVLLLMESEFSGFELLYSTHLRKFQCPEPEECLIQPKKPMPSGAT